MHTTHSFTHAQCLMCTSIQLVNAVCLFVCLFVYVVPPDFTATISDSFNCEQFPNASWQCVARFGQEGVLYCDYQSNPGGTLNITTDVANSSDVSIVNSTIAIESAASENAGTYTCTATNTIEGQERVTTREIRFFVGGK